MMIVRTSALDELAAAYKGFFCDITGIPGHLVAGWIDPGMTQNLSIILKTSRYIRGQDIATFAERVKAEEWSVAGLADGPYFLFKLPE